MKSIQAYEAGLACSKIPKIDEENRFFYWILANILQKSESEIIIGPCPLDFMLSLTQFELPVLQYIYFLTSGREPKRFLHADLVDTIESVPNIRDLIKEFQLSCNNSTHYNNSITYG